MDGDIAFAEMKARMVEEIRDAIVLEVHAVHMPVAGAQQVRAQVMTDESVDAEDQ